MRRGKKYLDAVKQYDKGTPYPADQAVDLMKKLAYAKFDETVQLSVKLNLKKSSNVRDTLVLPHQFTTEKKILVFAKGDKAKEAEAAGAAYVGSDDLVEKIKDGWLDFDVAVATPDMLKDVGRLGPILGRRGLMPNPKTRTVTNDLTDAIAELKKGRVEYRSDKTGVVNIAVGKVSMEPDKLADNINILISEIGKKRPSDSKGDFVKSIHISSTMGPGVKIAVDGQQQEGGGE